MSTYLFIDANYLRMSYQRRMESFFGNTGDLDLRKLKQAAMAEKAFYYDAIDDAAPDAGARESILREVSRYESFHVRQGTVSGGRRRRQKQVDVQLAVDMLGHAVRRNYTQGVPRWIELGRAGPQRTGLRPPGGPRSPRA